MKITPEQIKEARHNAGFTQAQAAKIVHVARRTWQDWEYGVAAMPPGLLELFYIKIIALCKNP